MKRKRFSCNRLYPSGRDGLRGFRRFNFQGICIIVNIKFVHSGRVRDGWSVPAVGWFVILEVGIVDLEVGYAIT